MGNGHTGTRIVDVRKSMSHNFILALTHLEETDGSAWCVWHVHSTVTGVSQGLSPVDFLLMLGLRRYEGKCAALNRQCHYKYVRELHRDTVGSQVGVPEFEAVVNRLHDCYQLADNLARRVGDHSDFVRWGSQVAAYLEDCGDRGVAAKGLILANTHKDVPLSERAKMQHFTETLVKVMTGPQIVGLTTMDLCQIWQDVTSGDVDIHTIIEELCDHTGGVYRYTHQEP